MLEPHPSSSFQSCSRKAHTFKATDLARNGRILGSTINRSALAGPMIRGQKHTINVRFKTGISSQWRCHNQTVASTF